MKEKNRKQRRQEAKEMRTQISSHRKYIISQEKIERQKNAFIKEARRCKNSGYYEGN